MNRSIAITALTLLAGSASAQSFNVDLGFTAGEYPTNFYSAAGKAGRWNEITSATPATIALKGLDSVSTPVTLTWDKSVALSVKDDPNTTGDAQRLQDDGQFKTSAGALTYTFKHLAAGTYAVFTYAGHPTLASSTSIVSVTNSSSTPQTVGGNVANDLPLGVSHSIHFITVPSDGTIEVSVANNGLSNAACTGLQLVKLDSQRLRFYVNKSQTANPEDGNSWASAYSDLQPLLQKLGPVNAAYCEVWVRQGFYYTTTGSDRTISFVLPSGIALYGGFSGDETSLADRTSPWSFITALSGAIGSANAGDNAYHVVDASDTTLTTLIDGFSIANGYASGSGETAKGAGLYARNTRVYARHCKFISNHAFDAGGAADTSLYPVFEDCLFYKNSSDAVGGALHHDAGGSPALKNCKFLGNQSSDMGGACNITNADAVFQNCLFSGNSTTSDIFGRGAGIYFYGDASNLMRLVNCTFSRNTSAELHGGFYVSYQAKAQVDNSILWGNTDSTAGSVLPMQYSKYSAATVTLQSTTVQGLSANPLFVDPDGPDNVVGTSDDDCRLQDNSPCIDLGSNILVLWDVWDADGDNNTIEPYPFDLDGNDRIIDVPWADDYGNDGNVDRGCYEYQYHTCPADFDDSGFVDLDDYSAFVFAFEAGTDNADFDASGFVDLDDFTAFVRAFEAGC